MLYKKQKCLGMLNPFAEEYFPQTEKRYQHETFENFESANMNHRKKTPSKNKLDIRKPQKKEQKWQTVTRLRATPNSTTKVKKEPRNIITPTNRCNIFNEDVEEESELSYEDDADEIDVWDNDTIKSIENENRDNGDNESLISLEHRVENDCLINELRVVDDKQNEVFKRIVCNMIEDKIMTEQICKEAYREMNDLEIACTLIKEENNELLKTKHSNVKGRYKCQEYEEDTDSKEEKSKNKYKFEDVEEYG